ncbi:hypothetical protein DKX38_028662 [Salix brachista]|uniref:Uncharacterized protein n=1 Tax=Salix brachista TaxID=2182728 RepID=A0A5N5J7V8_9ROSI|nr:hypothetical protein DKX38_028662 [Salix brachista]
MLINSIPKPNFLLSKIVELKDLAYASLVFNQLTKPNILAFNVMLRGLATTWKKYDFCADQLYYKLKSLGLKANNFTYPFLFIACGNVGGLVHGKIGHCLVFKTGLDGDEYVNHSLITMYARAPLKGSNSREANPGNEYRYDNQLCFCKTAVFKCNMAGIPAVVTRVVDRQLNSRGYFRLVAEPSFPSASGFVYLCKKCQADPSCSVSCPFDDSQFYKGMKVLLNQSIRETSSQSSALIVEE